MPQYVAQLPVRTLTMQQAVANAITPYASVGFDTYLVKGYTDCLVIDFSNIPQQYTMFSRLCCFTEVKTTKGRIVSQNEANHLFSNYLEDIHTSGFGVNSSNHEVLSFLEKLASSPQTINEQELLLQDILSQHGMNDGQLYGIAAISNYTHLGWLNLRARRSTLEHELLHSLYFLNEDYRAAVKKAWHNLSTSERSYVIKDLKKCAIEQDLNDEDILLNEFQAHFSLPPIGLVALAPAIFATGRPIEMISSLMWKIMRITRKLLREIPDKYKHSTS